MAIAVTAALALAARNLALAEAQGSADLVAPCSACYLVLAKARRFLAEEPALKARVDAALEGSGLRYGGTVRLRHPLDVLVHDVGLPRIAARTVRPLAGVRVAPYYGCQLVRPERGFDDREAPQWLDHLFRRVGAEVVDFPLKVACCGGVLMSTEPDVGRQLSGGVLAAALDAGATIVVTTCPLCQVNLELYQRAIGRRLGRRVDIPVVFFTQLLGVALGLSEAELGLTRAVVPATPALACVPPPHPPPPAAARAVHV
jgi:heterodisulfide reductase subunit B